MTTDTDSFCGHACILATGSKAAPKTGSDGSGYTLARKFGHHIIKPLPALVQLTSDNPLCKAMSGVRSTGTVTVLQTEILLLRIPEKSSIRTTAFRGFPYFRSAAMRQSRRQ